MARRDEEGLAAPTLGGATRSEKYSVLYFSDRDNDHAKGGAVYAAIGGQD